MAAANGPASFHMKAPSSNPGRHRKRPARACTARTPARLAPLAPTVDRPVSRKRSSAEMEVSVAMSLTAPPSSAQKQRWDLRGMWELASVINFFNVFRPVLSLGFEFTTEELESALINPNSTLDDIHIALLKAIPPASRTALGRNTWVTVLCKKLKDWWPWVAEGPFPLVPYHGEEVGTYKELDPETRVVILKALCEARLDQDDLRNYIDNSLKQGVSFSTFRKDRMGIDMLGNTYWYEHDPVSGQRLYRELRNSEGKMKFKGRGRTVPSPTTCIWETVATDLEEFQAVADKLASSKNRMEVAIGRRISSDIIPELEELQKKRERTLKRQQRQAVLLGSYFDGVGLATGRSRRERKPVTYTFDDYDRSINEAIKLTKRRQSSPESSVRADSPSNDRDRNTGNAVANSHTDSAYHTESGHKLKQDDISNSDSEFVVNVGSHRTRQQCKPQRYSVHDYVEAVSDNEADAYSEDEIEGEAVYDDDYIEMKKRKHSASSDGDEDYRGDEDGEDDDDDDDDDDMDSSDGDYIQERLQRGSVGRGRRRGSKLRSMVVSDDDTGFSDDGNHMLERQCQIYSGRGRRRGRKVKSVDELQHGLRRSMRATKSNIDYSKYEDSDFDDEYYLQKSEKQQGTDNLVQNRKNDRVMQDAHANSANSFENVEANTASGSDESAAHASEGDELAAEMDYFVEDSHKTAVIIPANGLKRNLESPAKPINKQHRLLDLNLAAPMGVGHDDGSAEDTGQAGSFNSLSQGDASIDDGCPVGNSGRVLGNERG